MHSEISRAEDAVLLKVAQLARAHARRILPADEADDLAHDIVLLMLERLRAGRPIGDERQLGGLLRRVVKRKAMNRLRGDRRRTEWEARYAREDGSERPTWMSPEVRFSEAELAEFRERILSELPDICRRAYVMIREEHATYERVAEELALSRSSIWNHVFAAEQRFRRALEALGISVAPSRRRSRRAA